MDDKNAADADLAKRDPQLFRNGAWSFERKYEMRSVVDGPLCQHRQVRLHGHRRRASEFRRQHHPVGPDAPKKRISIRPFFTETADNGPTMKAMQKAVHRFAEGREEEARCRRDRDRRMVQGRQADTAQDRRGDAGAIDRAGKSSGLTFHYPPYAVGPYAEGEYVAFVPWETLKPYLSPEGVKIFGGARAQGRR